VVVGKRHVFGESLAFLVVEHFELRVDLLDGPHRRSPVVGCNEIVVARRGLVAGLFCVLCVCFPLFRQGLERRADVDQALHLLAQFRHVGNDAWPAGGNGGAGVALVPINAVRLDDVIQQPALLVEPLDHRLALRIAVRPVAAVPGVRRRRAWHRRAGDRRTSGGSERTRLQERTAIQRTIQRTAGHDGLPDNVCYCARCAAAVTMS
jgi:hypothetical protein